VTAKLGTEIGRSGGRRPHDDCLETSAVGAEQIAHNRSEQGLVEGASVGGQQIAHNRSESGLDK